MSTWKEIDPHLKLERIRVRNFRNIRELDVTIPEEKNIICLVGPNGGGKSAVLSLIVNALCNLTHESGPDQPGISKFRRVWTTGEIGNEGPAFAFLLDCKYEDSKPQYQLSIKKPDVSNDDNFVSELREKFDIPHSDDWEFDRWKSRPSVKTDPLARSVFLFRPSDRFEIPYYEEEQDLSVAPRTAVKMDGQRLYPVQSKSGLSELESLILDMALDGKMGNRYGRWATTMIVSILKSFRGERNEGLSIQRWPFRRVGLGQLNALSLLSGGELDIIVTVGDIISQQLYLLQKFQPDTDYEVMPSGWVFIDEVDAHLHPQWQQKVLPVLSESFPTINFMVTTHSPFVLRSLPRNRFFTYALEQAYKDDDKRRPFPLIRKYPYVARLKNFNERHEYWQKNQPLFDKPANEDHFDFSHYLMERVYYDGSMEEFISPKENRRISLLPFHASHMFREMLMHLVYVGPLRRFPERYYSFTGNRARYVGKSGEFVADILLSDPKILDKINEQFEHLNLGYELKVANLRDQTSDIEKLRTLRLKETASGTYVGFTDVGFGISQLLPIVVQSMVYKGQMLLIEQPELHLHPALQTEMGDMFIRSALGRIRTRSSLKPTVST